MTKSRFKVSIEPLPTPRIRVARNGGRFYPKPYQIYKSELEKKLLELDIPRLEGYVKLHIIFTKTRPKMTKFQYPLADIDNLSKGLMDGLTQIGVWEDDKYVTDLIARKQFGDPSIEFWFKEI